MTRTLTRITLTLAVAATAALALTVGTAAAHGGSRFGSVSTTKLVNAGAKQLGVTSANLKAAIVKSANTQINGAVDDGDIDATEASDLKDEVADNLNLAYRLSRASTVASNAGVTTAKLNDAFRAARKALILDRIDAALADGDIDDTQAADLKAQLDKATLPGYKQSSLGSLGLDFGGSGGDGGGFGGGHGHGR